MGVSVGNTTSNAFQFKNIVADMFKCRGYNVSVSNDVRDYGYDLEASHGIETYLIEVKYSKTETISGHIVYEAALKLTTLSDLRDEDNIPILVVAAKLSFNTWKRLEEFGRLIVIDITNLIYMLEGLGELKNQLLSLLEYSIADLLPVEPKGGLFTNEPSYYISKVSEADMLIESLKYWNPQVTESVEYEQLCMTILKYLFKGELSLWKEQEKSNNDLFRFDLICKIKDGQVSAFWSILEDFFNTKYIIFEFKNYTDKITQREIYTIDKYLYLRALRGVAIIISCNGEDKNAKKAIRGTLRENGKLIVSVNNYDLIKMIEMRINDGEPADYLYDILDELLIDLEK